MDADGKIISTELQVNMDADRNNNSVSPLNSLLYQNIHQSGESRSEASSVESDSTDINIIAIQMNCSPSDLVAERFKVDRQKLENMIKDASASQGKNAAECFFDNIIETTSTRISWPCRLKIGAKTKKDPHVRIVGKPMNVMKAKDRVLAVLDSRGCRVIMKMDISYTDHSYIIGRGGNNIKKIMEDTMTHIHFPDSNRSNPTEKSNQVSLCGSMEGVEKARSLVRLSTPLIISFELPIFIPGRPMLDNNTEYVKDFEAKFNIQVIFSSRSKLHSSLVLVKGSEKEAANVKEATRLLIIRMCGNSSIPVNLQLEISPQHHDIVKGRNNIHIMSIMEKTKTKIIFPDLNDVNIKPIKKSQVTITGSIDGVYIARQQLIGNLPVALIFDFPENSIVEDDIRTLSHKFGVFIVVRQKSRQSTMCIVVKGVEKYVDKIYEARHILLDLPTPMVKAEVPDTYFASYDNDSTSAIPRQNLADYSSSFPDSPLTPGIGPNFASAFPSASFPNQFGNRTSQANISEITSRMPNLVLSPANLHHYHAMQLNNNNNQNSNINLNIPPYASSRSDVSPRSSTMNTSGYLSNVSNLNMSGSANSLEHMYPPYKPNIQNDLNGHYTQSDDQTFANTSNGNGMNLSCRLNEIGNHSFGDDNRMLTPNFGIPHRFIDYERKRLEGFKAMEQNYDTPKVRTPTNAWAGFGLGKTSPFSVESATSGMWQRENVQFASTTGLIDAIPTTDRIPLSHFKDIHSLLHHLKLEHYIKNFVLKGIDMKIFATLTSDDLMELNITAFGARKRLLLAINQLKKFEKEIQPSDDWIQLSEYEDIPSLLRHLKMECYIGNFVMHEIDMKMFVTLTADELAEIGIEKFVDKKRLLMAIDQLKKIKKEIQPNDDWIQLSEYADIPSLLTHLKMDRYVRNFVTNEIDIKMFVTLTANELVELGVKKFVDKKRLLMAIDQLKSERFPGPAAPGAERRPSMGW